MNRWGRVLRWVAALALGGWMAALALAAVKLDAWNDDLVHTLMQIRADATLRDRMRQQGEPIPREWGDYAWLHRGTPSLGPAHEKLLARAEAIALLLGPDAADQVRGQSGKALQRFRGQFAASLRWCGPQAAGGWCFLPSESPCAKA